MAKRKHKKDPYAAREADKYQHPISSRESIMEYLSDRKMPTIIDQIAKDLGLHSERDLTALRKRLQAMERGGQLICNRRGGYGIAKKMDLICGRVIGHPDGYGFLVADDGGDDVFLSARQMRSIIHGDRVMVQVVGIDNRKRREGKLVEVLERNTHEVVGRYFAEGGIGFVVASNARISQEIIIPPADQSDARVGQIVVVTIKEQPSRRSQPVGKVIEVLGEQMAPGMEIEIALRAHELPHRWSQQVEQEAAKFSATMSNTAPDNINKNREDIRDLPLVTIDGEDSRDFDDAVYCERSGSGWRLIVAIADVSYYVKPGAALDDEARVRGNSVYFPEQVIPMLPEILSNDLCSLNPDVDRLCMVAELVISSTGKLQKYRFFEGLMRSHARLTYTKVAAMLVKGDKDLCNQYDEILLPLRELYSLYKALRSSRNKRGAIDFDRPETRIVFGAQRKIEKIIPVIRNDAHRMVEEFMITANIAAAKYLKENKLPIVYRIHQGPTLEKLTDLRSFLAELGLKLGGGDKPTSKDYAKFIQSIAERPDKNLIETVLLRSLRQAIYSPDNIGHFGLSLESYTHFTSPIRRYTDLLVHRGIRHVIANKPAKSFLYNAGEMQELGDHCSMTERRADEATRDAVDWLKCEFMTSRIGQEFNGIITTVTSFGLFVELDDIYVEGLVHVTALENDYYHFDPIKHRMIGERTNMTYRIADKIRVLVARVDLDERKIDFVLAEKKQQKTKRATAKKTTRKKSSAKLKRTALRKRKRTPK